MVFNSRLYFHPLVAAVVAECLVCRFVSCQTDHTTLPVGLPTEPTGIPQSVLLALISVVGSLLGLVFLGIIALLCFYFTRKEKNSSLQTDRRKTAEESREFHTKPPVIGSSVHDVSRVVELVKSKGDRTDMAAASDRSFVTLVDRPVLNPKEQRIDVDDVGVEETKVTYMANYPRRFTDVTGDDDVTLTTYYEPTSEDSVFGSPVDRGPTYNPDGSLC